MSACFDEQGVGKTIEAIRAADLRMVGGLTVISPSVARVNWARELAKFGVLPRSTYVIETSKKPIPRDVDVLIVSQDMIANPTVLNQLRRTRRAILIVDEAHGFKNPLAARTKALYGEECDRVGGLSEMADCVWPMTGTPMPNHAGELWPHLRALAPNRILNDAGKPMGYVEFLRRFTFGRPGPHKWVVMGNRNVPELKRRLAGFSIRRRKKDVLKDLPPMFFSEVAVAPDLQMVKQVRDLEKDEEYAALDAILHVARQETGEIEQADDVFVERLAGEQMSRIRRLIGVLKVAPAAQLVAQEMEDPEYKLILFAHHKAVIAELAERLAEFNPVVLTGATSTKNRQAAIDRFQTDPETRLFIGQTDACNSAITLTAASNVLFVEPSWVPAINAQAAARAHRIGQKSTVFARFLVLSGTLDEAITSVLRRKTAAIAEILD